MLLKSFNNIQKLLIFVCGKKKCAVKYRMISIRRKVACLLLKLIGQNSKTELSIKKKKVKIANLIWPSSIS